MLRYGLWAVVNFLCRQKREPSQRPAKDLTTVLSVASSFLPRFSQSCASNSASAASACAVANEMLSAGLLILIECLSARAWSRNTDYVELMVQLFFCLSVQLNLNFSLSVVVLVGAAQEQLVSFVRQSLSWIDVLHRLDVSIPADFVPSVLEQVMKVA
jgi:hypothetical protein